LLKTAEILLKETEETLEERKGEAEAPKEKRRRKNPHQKPSRKT